MSESPSDQREERGLRTRPDTAGGPERLLQAEQQALHHGALVEAWQELTRRRREVRAALAAAVTEAGAEREALGALVESLEDSLAGLPDEQSAGDMSPDAAMVRELRQRLSDASIHLALHDRRRGRSSQPATALQSLSFGELVRLGLAFFLPVIAALLLAAGIIAVGLQMALGMP